MQKLGTLAQARSLQESLIDRVNKNDCPNNEKVMFCGYTIAAAHYQNFLTQTKEYKKQTMYTELTELCEFCQLAPPEKQLKKSELIGLLNRCRANIERREQLSSVVGKTEVRGKDQPQPKPRAGRPVAQASADREPQEDSLLPEPITVNRRGRSQADDVYPDGPGPRNVLQANDSIDDKSLPPPMHPGFDRQDSEADNFDNTAMPLDGVTGHRAAIRQLAENNIQDFTPNRRYLGNNIEEEIFVAARRYTQELSGEKRYKQPQMEEQRQVLTANLKTVTDNLKAANQPANHNKLIVLTQIEKTVQVPKEGSYVAFQSPRLGKMIKDDRKQGEDFLRTCLAMVGIKNDTDSHIDWEHSGTPLFLDPNFVLRDENNMFRIYMKGCLSEFRGDWDDNMPDNQN